MDGTSALLLTDSLQKDSTLIQEALKMNGETVIEGKVTSTSGKSLYSVTINMYP